MTTHGAMDDSIIVAGDRVVAAARVGTPVVALESSVFAQGLPAPANREALERMVRAIVAAGAAPAVIGVAQGVPTVGLADADLDRFLAAGAAKVSARDLPWAVASGTDGATTVAGTLAIAARAGLDVFATGGIGGVHRGGGYDESADLLELSGVSMVTVCAGAKSILDLAATVERLETLGVTVIGFQTDEFPGFFTARTGLHVKHVAQTPDDVARVLHAARGLGRQAGVLVVQAPPPAHALDPLVVQEAVEGATRRAAKEGIRGAALTPYLLRAVAAATGGDSIRANLALLEANARLAADVARAIVPRDPMLRSAHAY